MLNIGGGGLGYRARPGLGSESTVSLALILLACFMYLFSAVKRLITSKKNVFIYIISSTIQNIIFFLVT